jgi:hypothetical protein
MTDDGVCYGAMRVSLRTGERWLAGLVVALVAGCGSVATSPIGGDDGDPGDSGHDLVNKPNEGMQTQGPLLLGAHFELVRQDLDPTYHVSITAEAVTATGEAVQVGFDGGAALRAGTHRGADPYFEGMVLTASEGTQLRLHVSRGGYDLALYKVERLAPGGWVPLCTSETGEMVEAVPLAGRWRRDGSHEEAGDRFSLACEGSAAFKCTLWGYLAGTDRSALGWRSHQACTRMARADYCATGHTHTREGTHIQIFDFVGVSSAPPVPFEGVQEWPPPPTKLYFEAAWRDGAQSARCLSRLRWQSLPLGPLCEHGELSRDPRVDTGARFCDDLAFPAPGADPAGALLFNTSGYSALAMHVWQSGTDMVSTVRGLYDRPVKVPFADPDMRYVRRDGMVLRSLDTVDASQYVELHAYLKAGDRVISTQPPAPGYQTHPDARNYLEGYARRTLPDDPEAQKKFVALKLYVEPTTGDYASAVDPPAATYVEQATIGYVVRGETSEAQ